MASAASPAVPTPAEAFSQRVVDQVMENLAEHVEREGLDPSVLAELRQVRCTPVRRASTGTHCTCAPLRTRANRSLASSTPHSAG